MKKSISIIISAFNVDKYIEECLDSIQKQSYFRDFDDYEILVGIDNCTTTLDKLKEIKDKYKNLRVFMMESNKGTYITSNTLLDYCKYDYILRFDSDDIMRPKMIEVLLKEMGESDIQQMSFVYFKNGEINIKNNIVANGIALFKKEVFEELGGYQPWPCSADTDLLGRAKKHGFKIKQNPKHLFLYRQHQNSLTNKVNIQLRLSYHKKMRENNNIKIERVVNKNLEI